MQNKKSSSSEEKGLFNTRTDVLLLIGGAVFLLVNVIVIFGIDTRPNAWLFYFNARYWSVYFSAFLWITALWLVSESMSITEDYLPLIRTLAGIGILIVVISALRNFFGLASSPAAGHSLWSDVVLVVAICNVFRSLFLLYDYFFGSNGIDWEEAPWCWGVSGFIIAGLTVWGLMRIITVETQLYSEANVITESLFKVCTDGLRQMFQTGSGSFALQMFIVLLVVASIAFVYVLGRWLLIVYWKLRGN